MLTDLHKQFDELEDAMDNVNHAAEIAGEKPPFALPKSPARDFINKVHEIVDRFEALQKEIAGYYEHGMINVDAAINKLETETTPGGAADNHRYGLRPADPLYSLVIAEDSA